MIARRRFLAIAAGAGASALLTSMPRMARAARTTTPPIHQWRGIALGAAASITLAHPSAPGLVAMARAEIARLERIFSLYRTDSALSRLNRDGRLDAPPGELLALLSLCDALHQRTGGRFDPSIQPLWSLYARGQARGRPPSPAELAGIRRVVGWRHVAVWPTAIELRHAGAALTLNGIAQGFIADRITELLHAEGITDVVVNMGEIHASGYDPGGRPWKVGIADPDHPGRARLHVPLANMALATSAPRGTVLDNARTIGHILDPRTGQPGGQWRQVSVIAPSAALADGLSTAFCLMDESDIRSAAKDLRVELVPLVKALGRIH